MQAAAVKLLVCMALGATMVHGSPNVPTREQLTHKERMGRLMYVFTHLVHNYCKGSNIPDCSKVLTLYGMSNLVKEEIMRGDFKLPTQKSFYSNYVTEDVHEEADYESINDVDDSPSSYQVNQRINKLRNDPHPYAFRVPAPAKVVAAHATRMAASDLVTSDFDKVEYNAITHSNNTVQNVASDSPRPPLDIGENYITDKSDLAIGSSHPYAVKVLPEPTMPEPIPGGIQPTRDYEPIMMESNVQDANALPPTLAILKGK